MRCLLQETRENRGDFKDRVNISLFMADDNLPESCAQAAAPVGKNGRPQWESDTENTESAVGE